MRYVVESLEDTKKIAIEFAHKIKKGDLIKFYGDLGAGKTTFIAFVLKELGVNTLVTSPTFSLLKYYKTNEFEIAHFDMYRINTEEAIEAGFDEILNDPNIVKFVEWPDNVVGLYQDNYYKVKISFELEKRVIEI